MKYTLRFFGIPVVSFERDGDQFYISNTGGDFGFAAEEYEYDEDYEEEDLGFGFRGPK